MGSLFDDRLRGRLLRLGALAGALVWPAWWLLGGAGPSMGDEIHLALAGGITTIAPLALLLAAETDRRGRHLSAWSSACLLWPFAAGPALFALTLTPGPQAALLTAPWLLFSALVALFGAQRLGRRAASPLEEVAIDAGLMYFVVGGVWLLASRWGGPLLGYTEPWLALTAAHFHTAGGGLPILAGIACRAAQAPRRLVAPVLLAAILGPALTAVGIAVAPALEVAGSVVMCVAALGTGGLLVALGARGAVPVMGRGPLIVAGLVPAATMGLALLYALTVFIDPGAAPSMPSMVRWHGLPNAILFVAGGLAALALRLPPTAAAPPGVPFSTLRGGAVIGRWFFEERDAIDRGAPRPAGTVPDMAVFARAGVPGLADLDPDALHPAVRRLYEHTADSLLQVRAAWPPWIKPGARLMRLLARRVGQLDLPIDEREMDGVLLALRDGLDGRGPVVGWVRCHEGTDHPVYVAAYGSHRDRGVPYMNVALPIPGGCVHSILRMDPLADGGLLLTTRRPPSGRIGDAGLYLSTPLGPVRLPMHEELTVTAGAARLDDAALLEVVQRVWLFGVRLFTFTFRLTPRAPR